MDDKGAWWYQTRARIALRWYFEFNSGLITYQGVSFFDERLIYYKIDIERVFRTLSAREWHMLKLVNRDGLSAAESARLAGFHCGEEDACELLTDLECRVGKLLDESEIGNLLDYFKPHTGGHLGSSVSH